MRRSTAAPGAVRGFFCALLEVPRLGSTTASRAGTSRRAGSHGADAVERVEVMKLLWDTVSTARAFVDRCLAEYDLNGWQVPDLASFTDLGEAGRAALG